MKAGQRFCNPNFAKHDAADVETIEKKRRGDKPYASSSFGRL